EFGSFSELLDAYCSGRDLADRMKVKSHDILRLLTNASDRVSRKLTVQRKELEAAKERDKLRLYGDLINANIYRLSKVEAFCELENYYSEALETVRIPLDPMLSPAQNAQAYYKEYRRAQTAEAHLLTLIDQGERELEYIDAVFDALTRATSNAEVSEIRAELADEGYIKKQQTARKQPAALPPLRFVSDDGFDILVGRNNRQNEKLSLKEAARNDIWLHTAKIPGSHVIIRAMGESVPDSTIEQAAIIAACHSRARESGLVAVDYTLAKFVTRQPNSKVGMVNYTGQKTVYVHPDLSLADRLRK
ncbi:MAG: NFACT family protein, partial [Clostridia bacterium]|nr:NFACT family protein [Clostridia bacterium]